MGEFIHNTQEKIENNIGDVLAERFKTSPQFRGLGPPDLCLLTKLYSPPKFPGLKSTRISSYHYVMGLNTSSASSIATYIHSLLEAQEKSSFGRGTYKIESCHFVCYNAFQKQDLHIDFPISSGHKGQSPPIQSYSTSGLYGPDEKNPVDEFFWRETYISSMLRRVAGPPPFLRPVKILPFMSDPKEENEFLEQCKAHFSSGRLLGGFDSVFIDSKKNGISESLQIDDGNNLLATTLSNYFTMRNRYLPMLTFFESVKAIDPSVSVPIAVSLRLMTCGGDALEILESALEKSPEAVSVMMEAAKTLIHLAKRENPVTNAPRIQSLLLQALGYILKTISLKPKITRAWSIASNILFLLGSVEWALIFLNNSPVAIDDFTVDRIGKAGYARVSPPPEQPSMITVMEDDELEFDEEPGEEFLKCLTAVTLSGDSSVYYGYLVSMYKKIGWESLLEKKSKVLDELAKIKNKKIAESNVFKKIPIRSDSPSQEGNSSTFKEGHNTLSPTNKHKATENLTDSSDQQPPRPTINPSIQKQLWREEDVTPSEGSDFETPDNIENKEDEETKPTEGEAKQDEVKQDEVKQEEDKQEEVKEEDITQGLNDVDLTSPEGNTTTQQESSTPPPPTITSTTKESEVSEIPPRREEFKNHATLQIENLSDVLSSFIDNYGVDSLKDKSSKEYIVVEFGQDTVLKARLPVVSINKNLELAFHSLFQDIKAFKTWREEAETKKLDILPNQSLKHMNPIRTIADWTRLGRLSQRLGDLDEAEKIYKWVFEDTKFSHRALLGLIQIFTEHGEIRDTLNSSSSLLRYYFSDKVKCHEMHPAIERSILNLISINGLQKVRNIHSNLTDPHPSINNLFLDTVKWRSNGFDK